MTVLNPVLDSILQKRQIVSKTGEIKPLHSNISTAEGDFITEIISRFKPRLSLEIGCAYGISSLYICQALKQVGAKNHIIIDPSQHLYWEGTGLANLERAGLSDIVTFYAERSYSCLPRLDQEGVRIEFALIDGAHTFDYALVDFFHVDKILNVGGVIIFDDLECPPVRKVARYALRNLKYKVVGPDPTPSTGKRRLLEWLAGAYQRLGKVLRADIAIPDHVLGLPSGNFVALQKTAEDKLGDYEGCTRTFDAHSRF